MALLSEYNLLSVRAFQGLKSAGITTTEQLNDCTDDELMRIRNLGRRSFEEVLELRKELRQKVYGCQ